MAKHYNPSISERAQRQFNFKAGESLTDDITGPVAVIPVSPITKFLFHSQQTTSAASNSIIIAASDKDTYITAVSLAIAKDATCDNTDTFIDVRANVDGVAKRLALLPIMTLTAQDRGVFVTFPNPVKIDRGASITANQSTFTAGKFMRAVCLYGYTEEVTAS